MENFKFHLRSYFNLNVPLPAVHFAIIYLLMTFLWSFFLVSFIHPEQIQGVFEGEVERFSLSVRMFMLSYELVLLPLYIKRLLDIGWIGLQRDLAVMGLLLAPVISSILSDGGFEQMLSILAFLRVLALILTFVLFFMPSHKQKSE